MRTVLFNPYTGTPRHPADIQSDPEGLAIIDDTEPLRAAREERLADRLTGALRELNGAKAPIDREGFAAQQPEQNMTTTERYIRKPRVWVKITRDSEKKTFGFCTGYTGEVKGFEVTAWSFHWVPTWADAMEMAETKARDYQ